MLFGGVIKQIEDEGKEGRESGSAVDNGREIGRQARRFAVRKKTHRGEEKRRKGERTGAWAGRSALLESTSVLVPSLSLSCPDSYLGGTEL